MELSVPIEPAEAERAFLSLRSRLLGLADDHLVMLTVDLQRAAVTAAAVARVLRQPAVRQRFLSLPRTEFDHTLLDDLEPAALAAWHVSAALVAAAEGEGEATLPVSLIQSSSRMKQRMLALAEYHFGDDAAEGPEVASIKQGTGHADLASDLSRLAELYERNLAHVKLDPKNYVATDAVDARRCAGEILRLLAEQRSKEQRIWADLMIRAWTLLVDIYAEVSAAGGWLFRNERGAARIPSLYVAGRMSAPPAARTDEPGEEVPR